MQQQQQPLQNFEFSRLDGQSTQPSALNPFDDWSRLQENCGGVNDYLMEEIRARSHEILENDEMQQMLRILSMGGAPTGLSNVDSFPSYPSPAPAFSFEDECSRPLVYEGQDQATAAVGTGKADAMLADSPVVAYAVKQSGGKIEAVGDIYDAAPYGYVIPKDETDLANAIVAALKSLDADGDYKKVLETWGVEAGAISDFAANPSV
jgi:hypothetical protein